MKQKDIFVTLAVVSFFATMFGAYQKILHRESADRFLTVGLICFAIFWITTLWQLLNSNFNTQRDRILWLLFVLLMPFIGALLFQLMKKNFTKPAVQ
jgi:predicted membrane channel-forming protein YqfA (hemolysin III family)